MASEHVKEEIVGTQPLAHSVEMRKLDDGTFEIVGRLMVGIDKDGGSYSSPLRSIEVFPTQADAEFRYHQLKTLMEKVGPPT